jgi:hypothetical protein
MNIAVATWTLQEKVKSDVHKQMYFDVNSGTAITPE